MAVIPTLWEAGAGKPQVYLWHEQVNMILSQNFMCVCMHTFVCKESKIEVSAKASTLQKRRDPG